MKALTFVSLLLVGLAGCGDLQHLGDYECPPEGTALTWDGFGEPFMATHCQTCHGMPLGERQRAPVSYDFGTQDAVRKHADRIFARSAADNTTMPPGKDVPSRQSRYALAEWLACGAPE